MQVQAVIKAVIKIEHMRKANRKIRGRTKSTKLTYYYGLIIIPKIRIFNS